jgi:hypothetical protein
VSGFGRTKLRRFLVPNARLRDIFLGPDHAQLLEHQRIGRGLHAAALCIIEAPRLPAFVGSE